MTNHGGNDEDPDIPVDMGDDVPRAPAPGATASGGAITPHAHIVLAIPRYTDPEPRPMLLAGATGSHWTRWNAILGALPDYPRDPTSVIGDPSLTVDLNALAEEVQQALEAGGDLDGVLVACLSRRGIPSSGTGYWREVLKHWLANRLHSDETAA